MKQLLAIFLVSWTLNGCSSAPDQKLGEVPYARSLYDFAGFTRPVMTESIEAQAWFDRGLVLCYGFNHEEAIRCFQKAQAADPGCAMAWWGAAYAAGPNINNPIMDEAANELAWQALQAAELLAERSELPGVERDLIAALGQRYESPAPEDRAELDRNYAQAMRLVSMRHPDDADLCALTAEAWMDLAPWALWSKAGEAHEVTPFIRTELERGLQRWPNHPALCHFYIHTMEASPMPELALPAADALRTRIPGAGHLVHMPSHIDIQLGHYEQAIEANRRGIAADALYVEAAGRMNFYSLYRVHNLHFLVYAAMFDGQFATAQAAAQQIMQEIPEPMLLELVDFLDAFVPTELHVLVRFGRWREILDYPEPREELIVGRTIRHYARGIAYAVTGRVELARREQALFEGLRAEVPETRMQFNNTCADILQIASHMLGGEIEYRDDDPALAFQQLRRAAELDDALNYDEPWGWMQPARHALGALLLESNQASEALTVYREDLKRHPNNGWALHGLAECQRSLGRISTAEKTEMALAVSWKRSDTQLRASCFCRR